jgi:DNA repair exonuclease SbcCD ATPase subunit
MWIGERHHKGELVHQSEPILDVNLFERVQQRLKNKTNRPIRMIKNTNWLKGILFCECGRSMFMNVQKAKRVNSYYCLSKLLSKQKKCEPCSHPSVNIDKLLQSSYLTLVDKYISRMKDKGKTNFDDKIANKKIEITNAENLIKKLNKKLDNLYDDYNERLINKSKYIRKKEELENDIQVQEEKLNDLRKELKHVQDLKNKPLKESYSFDQYLQEVRNIVERIVIGSASKKMDWMKKTKTDVVIKVSITTITGEIITYHLSKFMGKINPAYLDGSFIVDAELEGDYLKINSR